MADLIISQTGNERGGRYDARLGGADAGHLDWERRGEGVRAATHTLVMPEMRGRGVAEALVDALIEDARREGFRIAPECSFVAAQFARHPEWASLRA